MVIVFAATAALVLSRHEMWMDELNPWLIARDAHSLRELFFNMRFEPHPALWYLCLYALTRFTTNPAAMQVLHGLIATASMAVIAYWSPFRRRDIILLAFSYYFLFEFCAISRGYALGLLLILIACALASSARPRPIAIAVALALAANTSAFALIVAIALAYALIPKVRQANARALAAAAALVLAGAVISFRTLLPSPDSVYGSDRHFEWRWGRVDDVARLAGDAFFPLPDFTARSPWNSNGLERAARLIPVAGHFVPLALGIIVIALALYHLRDRPSLRAALIAGMTTMLALMYIQYSGGYRHHGHIFVLTLAVLWLSANPPRWLTAMLAVQAIAGLFFVQADVRLPFSDSKLLVQFLQQQPRDAVIVAAQPTLLNYEGPELASYLRGHVFYATAGGVVRGSYMWYDRARNRDASEAEIVNEIEQFADSIDSDVFVVTSHWNPATLGAPLFAPSAATIEGDERNSAIYLCRRQHKRG